MLASSRHLHAAKYRLLDVVEAIIERLKTNDERFVLKDELAAHETGGSLAISGGRDNTAQHIH